MIFWFLLGWLLLVLAAARITNALVSEDIFQPLRQTLEGTFFGRMLDCYWCTSFWVAGLFAASACVAAVVLTDVTAWGTAAVFPIIWCSSAYGVGWIIDHEE